MPKLELHLARVLPVDPTVGKNCHGGPVVTERRATRPTRKLSAAATRSFVR